MDHSEAAALLARLHAAQNDFYAGGGDAALRAVLSPDISWHVPGQNAIAGDYEGVEAVLSYFARRRDLAGGTFRMHPGELLTGTGPWVASLTDGEAVVGGRKVRWSTVGLYRTSGGKVTECRLLPFDSAAFDAVWATTRAAAPSGDARTHAGRAAPTGASTVRVRPRHCDAQGMVYAGRYHEFFEDAFLDWLEQWAGGYGRLRESGVDLVIVASGCEHHRPARLGDLLSVETAPGRTGPRSLTMVFTVRGPEGPVATGRFTYVTVGARGQAVALPAPLLAAAGA